MPERFGLVVLYRGTNILQCISMSLKTVRCDSVSLQGHAMAGYAPLITAYIKVLMSRITFTIKVSIQ